VNELIMIFNYNQITESISSFIVSIRAFTTAFMMISAPHRTYVAHKHDNKVNYNSTKYLFQSFYGSKVLKFIICY